MSTRFDSPAAVMHRALSLAVRGIGHVEPNPPVGAVVVDSSLRPLGEGWHERYGGPHAEVNAIAAAGESCRGATLFVTLEPCAHFGKTPPCVDAVIEAGIRKVIVATRDPAMHSGPRGIETLQAAGLDVEVGLLENEARELIAPFSTLMNRGRPWVLAKWAMSLDGKIATRTGQSKWISNEQSRTRVHELRGRMDGIVVGIGTVLADDPRLTARPAGPRVATRIVLDSRGRLPADCQLMRTTGEAPLLVVTTESTPARWREMLTSAGAEVIALPAGAGSSRIDIVELCRELGRRRMTNVLVEGGGEVLGSFFDAGLIDECRVFVAPKVIGGRDAPSPVGGIGAAELPSAWLAMQSENVAGDLYCRIVIRRDDAVE